MYIVLAIFVFLNGQSQLARVTCKDVPCIKTVVEYFYSNPRAFKLRVYSPYDYVNKFDIIKG